MEFKVNNKFVYDNFEYLITSIIEENIHNHNNFEKSDELVLRVRTNITNVEFIVYLDIDRVILNKSLDINLSDIDFENIKKLNVLDNFSFVNNNFILKNIFDVDDVNLGLGKNYIFVCELDDRNKLKLSVTYYLDLEDVNSVLFEVRELTNSDFNFL